MSARAVLAACLASLVLAACATPKPVPAPPPAAPTPAERCEEVFSRLVVLPDFQREFTTPLLRMGEQAPPLFLESFVATCIARPAADLTCLEAQLDECEALEGVLRMTSKAFAAELMSSLTPEQRIATAVESARSEARFVLEAIGAGARAHQAEAADPSSYRFPGAVGITPAEDCCSQGGQCIPDEAAWASPTWKTLGIEARDPHRYQYEFESRGKGPTAGFTARAVGDPLCGGKTEVWELEGSLRDGVVQLSKPQRVH